MEPQVAKVVVLDAGPIIRNDPIISSLVTKSEQIVTSSSVLFEIRDQNARSRLEVTLKPFLTLRRPNATSLGHIRAFARRTGDLPSLSNTDLEILALTYELECEHNGGDWRLRSTPGQKRINGRPNTEANGDLATRSTEGSTSEQADVSGEKMVEDHSTLQVVDDSSLQGTENGVSEQPMEHGEMLRATTAEELAASEAKVMIPNVIQESTEDDASEIENEDDEGGWITPSNINSISNEGIGGSKKGKDSNRTMQVACVTEDYAMQNVCLQMNLNLLSTSFKPIRQLKMYILRCHGCFALCRDMSKQFCPKCGQATLTRVSCTTSERGEVKIHLKKNMQWNNKGNRYSVPKAATGPTSENAKGQAWHNNWGARLVLAGDQKEYTRAIEETQRAARKAAKEDDDDLPDFLRGKRNEKMRRPRVGAGRNINAARK